MDSAALHPDGVRMPRPRSISGNRMPLIWNSVASSSLVIGRVPSRVRRRIQSSAAARIASSSSSPATRLSCRCGPDSV